MVLQAASAADERHDERTRGEGGDRSGLLWRTGATTRGWRAGTRPRDRPLSGA